MKSKRLLKLSIDAACSRAAGCDEQSNSNVIELLFDEVSKLFEQYDTIISEEVEIIESDAKLEDREAQIKTLADEFAQVSNAVSEVKLHLAALKPNQSTQIRTESFEQAMCTGSSPITSNAGAQHPMITTTNIHRRTTLPKLTLPSFSGKIEDWIVFRDMFLSTIDSNDAISPVERFQYLKSLLTGEALALVSGIPMTATNYPVAWNKLDARFNRPSLIVRAVIQKFMDIESVSLNLQNLQSVVSGINETLELLDAQGKYASTRDPWIIFLILAKLNSATKLKWAEHSRSSNEPHVEDLLHFLNERVAAVEISNYENQSAKPQKFHPVMKKTPIRASALSANKCIFCSEQHTIQKCQNFRKLDVKARSDFISSNNRCFNCFGRGHSVKTCASTHSCLTCKGRHHTMLHRTPPISVDNPHKSESIDQSIVQLNSTTSNSNFLPTAVVSVVNGTNNKVPLRVLLDSGSQANFISERAFRQLGLKRDNTRIPINWLSDGKSLYSKGKVALTASSIIDSSYTFTLKAHIISSLTGQLPQVEQRSNAVATVRERFALADPYFDIPADVDLILGASIFISVLKSECYLVKADHLYVKNTKLGHVVCSSDESQESALVNTLSIEDPINLERIVEAFWLTEELPESGNLMSEEEQQCELSFQNSVRRLASGRFSVDLPFRSAKIALGHSHQMVARRFRALERKFDCDSEFKGLYTTFMNEYLQLGHMRKSNIPLSSLQPGEYFVIPHHGIIQHGKLRVVFDASAKTDNGQSLNDNLFAGPSLQADLFGVINRFRQYPFVLTADIEKMYRQIEVNEHHRRYQMVLWRSSQSLPLELYELNTVTYGATCSPFLALRTIKELAKVEEGRFPRAVEIMNHNRYVDDLLFGCRTETELRECRDEVKGLLQTAGFNLRKWASNCPGAINDISTNDLSQPTEISLKSDFFVRTLGIIWCPTEDSFSYRFTQTDLTRFTKRSLLATSARLFDPLGWVTPVILRLKILFQETWARKLEWDADLPHDIRREFCSIHSDLPNLELIRIDRFVGDNLYEIHGFADASKQAYAAAIYIRATRINETSQLRLLCAKSKVAPVHTISIARLELCAAHLLCKLLKSIITSLESKPSRIVLWSDSQIVLAWIRSIPRKWTTFVANRVSQINDLVPSAVWLHVPTKLNPADIASRGVLATQLVSCSLWWNGPDIDTLTRLENDQIPLSDTEEELAPMRIRVATLINDEWSVVIKRFSNSRRLIRSIAYVLRFTKLTRHQPVENPETLTADDLDEALNVIISLTQRASFHDEFDRLKKGLPISSKSVLKSISPFLDDNLILRAADRLSGRASHTSPIILPQGKLSELLMRTIHHDRYHAGP